HEDGSASDDSGVALLWLVGGVLVTVTFAAAAGGGKFIIAVGPIAYGLSRLLRR
ncbi:MAG: hypothetical protein JNM69_25170, partial [Archangium sp.]|nr:hypothetical protein [Archangium sp.]